MGFFEMFCSESQLVLGGDTALIFIGETLKDVWTPITVPMCNSYDRLGRIDLPGDFAADESDKNAQLILSFLKQCTTEDDKSPEEGSLGGLVDEHLKEGFLSWKGTRISYVLIDQRIYRAIAKTVETGTKPEWKPFSNDSLDKLDFQCLFETAFELGKVSTAIYQPKNDGGQSWLSDGLKELCRYKAWGAQFQAFDLDADGPGQCSGYAGDYGTKEYCQKARKKYKHFPLILQAVEENALHWKELDS